MIRHYFSELVENDRLSEINDLFYKNIGLIHSQNTIPFGPLVYGLVYSINPKLVIETGTNSGYITAWLAKACLELNIPFYTIDWYNNNFSYWYEHSHNSLSARTIINLTKCGVIEGITELVNAEVISYLTEAEKIGGLGGLGLVVIDDCHDEDHVYSELQIFWRNLVPGGLIALHDVIDIPQVRDGITRFIADNGVVNRLWFFESSGYAVIQKNK